MKSDMSTTVLKVDSTRGLGDLSSETEKKYSTWQLVLQYGSNFLAITVIYYNNTCARVYTHT